MNKKSFIALGLTISLANVPTLSEVSKANEVSNIQDISLLSTEIDEAMQSVKVDQLSMDDFALTILEQPDIVDLEVMEDLPEHQEKMREDAEEYLKDIKPELIDLNERSILVAQYMELYNDYFVSEIERVQEKKSSEQEARQKIEVGLQDLTVHIEKEQAEINDTQKGIEDFLVNLEEDHEAFEASVVEAEKYVIAREGEIAEEIETIKESNKTINKRKTDWFLFGTGMAIVAGSLLGFAALQSISYSRVVNRGPAISRWAYLPNLAGVGFGAFMISMSDKSEVDIVLGEAEKLEGANLELANIEQIRIQSGALAETTDNVTTSLDNLTNEWDALQSNIHTMADVMSSENLYDLKPQFEGASIAWENTKNVSEVYQQLDESTGDPIEIDLDGIDTEEEFEEALKEAHDVDELIDISELSEEELKELLRELLEEELAEAA